ncbi:MAG: ADP-glyceromanno-heptose 6-epimerase [Deltaproteobacteria bacterium]|nr:ADP-glyceromanno-heptose 6-epimerase [Deltaproteobacteria bacterium]
MIVVTGGAGFIGSAFIWRLNREGIEDIVVVDRLGSTEKWKNLVPLRYADYFHKDTFLSMVMDDSLPFSVDAVIHMGACSSTTERDADYLMENNYRYSRRLAEWAITKGIRFIYASSAATYGDGARGFSDDDGTSMALRPVNMYGYSKQRFDLWVLQGGFEKHVAGLKFFNVYGPNEHHKREMRSVVHKSFGQIVERGRVRLFKSHRPEFEDGGQQRDFVYVKDCVEVMRWLLEHRAVMGIFNLGTGRSRTWNDLAGAVFNAMHRTPEIEYIAMPESIQAHYQYFTEARMEKLKTAGCDIRFSSLEEGIADYVEGYLLNGEQTLALPE